MTQASSLAPEPTAASGTRYEHTISEAVHNMSVSLTLDSGTNMLDDARGVPPKLERCPSIVPSLAILGE